MAGSDDPETTNKQELVSLPESWDAQAQKRSGASMPRVSPPGGRSMLTALRPYILVAGVVSVAALGVAVWMRVRSPEAPPIAPSVAASVAVSAPAPSAAPAPAPPSAVVASPVTSRPSETTACVKSFFPEGTFEGREPDFSSRCGDRRAYRGMLEVKSALVAAAGKHRISKGMQLWSKLGWYETAAYAYIRERCCSNPLPLQAPKVVQPCKFQAAVGAIAAGIDDDAALDRALDGYHKAVECVFRSGAGEAFDRWEPVYGGERGYFDKLIGR